MQNNSFFMGLWLSGTFALAGCNASVTDFVKSATPSNIINPPVVAVVSNGPMALKVSPGQMKASATNGAVLGNVSPTNMILRSSDVTARVAISRSRTSPP